MSRAFASGSSQVAQSSAIGYPTRPLTVVMRIRITGTGNYFPFAWSRQSTGYPAFRVFSANGPKTIYAYDINDSGSPAFVQSSNSYTLNSWSFLACMYVATNSRKIYLDGTVTTNSSTISSQTLSLIDRLGVGAYPSSGSYTGYLQGEIAELALYSAELTTAELDMLNAGYTPPMVRPQSLIDYWPFIGRTSPEVDIVGGYGLTLINSPSASSHPPIIYTPSTQVQHPSPATPADLNYVLSDDVVVSDAVSAILSASGIVVSDSAIVGDSVTVQSGVGIGSNFPASLIGV